MEKLITILHFPFRYISTGSYAFGGLKTTLSFSDLLGGLTELRKAVILTIMVYYSQRIQIKISKGKKLIAWRGETRINFQFSFPSGVI